MNTKNYKTIQGFICDVLSKYEDLKYDDDFTGINIVAHYDEALEILNYLVKNTDFDMEFIEISDPYWDNYCDEFIVSIDDNGHINCQKAIYEGRKDYINVNEFTFVSADTNSKFVVQNKDIPMIEFSLGESDDECDCSNTKYNSDYESYSGRDDDGNDYHITIKGDLDLDEAFAKLDKMETKMSRINDMFSEMDNFRRLFRW